jgi:hypothetical protein
MYHRTDSIVSAKLISHRHDFRETFDILVGKAPSSVERFTLHTSVLTPRSKFLHAARKPEWLDNPSKPVDLTTEDPEVFQEYLNLVYMGPAALGEYIHEYVDQTAALAVELVFNNLHPATAEKELIGIFEEHGAVESVHFEQHKGHRTGRGYIRFNTAEDRYHAYQEFDGYEQLDGQHLEVYQTPPRKPDAAAVHKSAAHAGNLALIKLWLLADRLQDFAAANTVISHLISFFDKTHTSPEHESVKIAYESTVEGSPLRVLLRDAWVHKTPEDGLQIVDGDNYPDEFLQDIAVEFMRVKMGQPDGEDPASYCDGCRYHHHDDQYPLCKRWRRWH